MGTNTDTAIKIQPTDKWYERCLKLMARVDWRGLAIVLAALAGIGGAIWNQVNAMLDKALASRTQQGVYEVLASKLDDISVRLEALEKKHGIEPKLVPIIPDKPMPGKESGKASEGGSDIAKTAVVTIDVSGAPVISAPKPLFPSAQLPSFQAIQKHAQENEMPRLLRQEIVAAPSSEGTN